MRVSIAGHVAIDFIRSPSLETSSLGGPPCYAGLMVKQLGSEVLAVTKIGYDFPDEYSVWLSRNQLALAAESRSSSRPTTRFRIEFTEQAKNLRLLSRCEELATTQLSHSDAIILSGIANEISADFARRARKLTKFLFLDPQTILRSFSAEGKCIVARPKDPEVLSMADCLKGDSEEALVLTGKKDKIAAAKDLQKLGIGIVLITDKREVLLASRGEYYMITLPASRSVDTTGAGDIFSGAFVASFLRTNDPIWATCVAAAASSQAVKQVGISKVPSADIVLQAAESIKRSGISRLNSQKF